MTDFSSGLFQVVQEGDGKKVIQLVKEALAEGLPALDILEKAGLKNKVKVMIGGAPVSRAYADEIGTEGFAEDCASAVDEATRLMALVAKGGSK